MYVREREFPGMWGWQKGKSGESIFYFYCEFLWLNSEKKETLESQFSSLLWIPMAELRRQAYPFSNWAYPETK